MRARIAAGSSAIGDGVDEASRLLRTGDPAILAGAAGYMLFDVAMLGVCFAAFGNDVPPAAVLLVAYIVGQLRQPDPDPRRDRRCRRRSHRRARAATASTRPTRPSQ